MKLLDHELKRKAKLSALSTLRNLKPNKRFIKMSLYYELIIYELFEEIEIYDASLDMTFTDIKLLDSVELFSKTDHTRLPWGEK